MAEQMLKSGVRPAASRTPAMTSLGNVDEVIRGCYGCWVPQDGSWLSSTMQTGDIQVFLWTWKGKMTLDASYNEAFYTEALVEELLVATVDELSMWIFGTV
jgi:hypothetical protein